MYHFILDKDEHRHMHFIGIGGISMSGLAEIAHNAGYCVSGSDRKKSENTQRLEDLGIKVYYGHEASHVEGANLVIYTDAIGMDNPELRAAMNRKIDVVDRATFLGALMENYKEAIAVSGTHGKTTTTSMLAEIFYRENPVPTILLGGMLDHIQGNVLLGDRELLLTEACEYKANILKYRPTIAVLLNVDEDHLDYFDNIDHIVRTFRTYVEGLKPTAKLIVNADDSHLMAMMEELGRKAITVSVEGEGDFVAKNLDLAGSGIAFDLYVQGEFIDRMKLHVLGRHNVTNALAAMATAWAYGMDLGVIKERLSQYTGVHRRLEFKALKDGVTIMDDYAHHPTEVEAVLHALKPTVKGKLICVFQPHTFTRTKKLLNSFAKSFTEADVVMITDIYAAREKDYGDIHSRMLVEAIEAYHPHVSYQASFDDVIEALHEVVKPGDTVLTMGAGDVYLIGDRLIQEK